MNFNPNQCPYKETKCISLPCPCPKYQAYLDVQNPDIIATEIKELGINTNDSWEKVMGMQTIFASRFHATKNISKEVTDHWNKEYCICIEDEVEELEDYIKKYSTGLALKDDPKELRKEVIDIFHFVMDILISGGCSANELFNRFTKKFDAIINTNDKFSYMFYVTSQLLSDKLKISRTNNDNIKKLWKSTYNWDLLTQEFIIDLLCINREIRQQISWKHWKKPNNEIDYNTLYNVYTEMIYRFMILVVWLFDKPEDVINMYITKNIENIRRQKNGY